MTYREIVERVQMHHPGMGHSEIQILINLALKDIASKTKIVRGSNTFDTVADQRYYKLDVIGGGIDEVLEIIEVFYDYGTGKGTRIPLVLNSPSERDE